MAVAMAHAATLSRFRERKISRTWRNMKAARAFCVSIQNSDNRVRIRWPRDRCTKVPLLVLGIFCFNYRRLFNPRINPYSSNKRQLSSL